MILQRTVRRRFLVQATTIVVAATLLALLVFARQARAEINWAEPAYLLRSCRNLLSFVAVAAGIAAPLALLRVLISLRRTGVLETCCAAGLSPGHLLRMVGGAAMLTGFFVIGVMELSALTRGDNDATSRLWASGDHWVWRSKPEVGLCDLVLFESDSLDAWRVGRADWSPVEDAYIPIDPRAIVGRELVLDRIAPPPARPAPFAVLPISRWLSPGVTFRAVLLSLVHVLQGPLLVFFAAYLALLIPGDRLGRGALLFIALVLCAGLATATLTLLLWHGGWPGPVAVGVWLLTCLTILCAAHETFRRRGLRGALR